MRKNSQKPGSAVEKFCAMPAASSSCWVYVWVFVPIDCIIPISSLMTFLKAPSQLSIAWLNWLDAAPTQVDCRLALSPFTLARYELNVETLSPKRFEAARIPSVVVLTASLAMSGLL